MRDAGAGTIGLRFAVALAVRALRPCEAAGVRTVAPRLIVGGGRRPLQRMTLGAAVTLHQQLRPHPL